jgi:hypothetical protein
MKRNILLISLILTLSCCEKITEYPSLDNFRITKILNFSNSNDLEPSGFVNLDYDEAGNLIKESLYSYPNTLYTYREYDYENNALIEKRIYDGQAGNLKPGSYIKYEYENNKLTRESLFLAGGYLKYTSHFEYIGNNLSNTYKISNELGIHHQYKYTFNDLDLLILEETFMYDQKLDGFIKYFYDENNRLSKSENYNNDGTLVQTKIKNYKGNNNLSSEEIITDSTGTITKKYQNIYDNMENLLETRIINGQEFNALFKKKYNGKLLVEHIQYAETWGYSEWYVTRYEYSKFK